MVSRHDISKLGIQIPAVATCLAATLGACITALAVYVAGGSLRESAMTQLTSIVDERAAIILEFAARTTADLHVMSEDTGFHRALRTFSNLVGEDASPGSATALAREQFDPRFRAIAKEKQFSDILLINEKGVVAYSSTHRHDGTSVAPGSSSAPLVEATRLALSAKDAGVVAFADFAPVGGQQRAYFVQALPDVNGGWLGVIAVEMDLASFSRAFNAPFGETGTVVLADARGQPRSLLRSGSQTTGSSLSVSHDVPFFDKTWTLSGQQALSEIEAPATKLQTAVVGSAVLLLIASTAIMVFYMRRRLSRPIREITNAMHRLADGHLDEPIPCLERVDEIGDMAHSLVVFRDAAHENRRLQDEQEIARHRSEAERRASAEAAIASERSSVLGLLGTSLSLIAQGDLRSRMVGDVPAAYLSLQEDFNAALEDLDLAVSAVATAAKEISTGTQMLRENSQELSQQIEVNAASLEETSAALADVASTIQHSAATASDADRIVKQTRSKAMDSGEIIAAAVAAMQRIESSSREIGHIISVVDEIAFQTNLLALNAGVEAARAGETGRGFAVVAAEVRALAQRSAEAAKQIKQLIGVASSNVTDGVRLVENTRISLGEIIQHVDLANAKVQVIATGSRDQAAAVAEINSAVERMSQATQESAAMVEETAGAIANLSMEAADLGARSARFHCSTGNATPSAKRPSRSQAA